MGELYLEKGMSHCGGNYRIQISDLFLRTTILPKGVEMADFALSQSPKLISRKI